MAADRDGTEGWLLVSGDSPTGSPPRWIMKTDEQTRLELAGELIKGLVDLWVADMSKRGLDDVETIHHEGGGERFSIELFARKSFDPKLCAPWFSPIKNQDAP